MPFHTFTTTSLSFGCQGSKKFSAKFTQAHSSPSPFTEPGSHGHACKPAAGFKCSPWSSEQLSLSVIPLPLIWKKNSKTVQHYHYKKYIQRLKKENITVNLKNIIKSTQLGTMFPFTACNSPSGRSMFIFSLEK